MASIFTPQNIQLLQTTFLHKKKERFDIILEPLQAILQLACIGYSPVGTKIAIQNNLLEIQYPSYSQGIIRWYNNDNKEDLFYLFNACRRFSLFYRFLKDIQYGNAPHENLYDLLITSAKEGFNKLSQTYNHIDKVSLLHTLQMYKVILDNPKFFENDTDISSNITENTNVYENHDTNTLHTENNIDTIFIHIRSIYKQEELYILMNVLRLLQRCEESECNQYILGINTIMKSSFSKIKKWINDNIVF